MAYLCESGVQVSILSEALARGPADLPAAAAASAAMAAAASAGLSADTPASSSGLKRRRAAIDSDPPVIHSHAPSTLPASVVGEAVDSDLFRRQCLPRRGVREECVIALVSILRSVACYCICVP